MWPRYTGENQRTLEPDDVAGICFLYPGEAPADAGVPDAGDDGGAADTGAPVDSGAGSDGGSESDARPADTGPGGRTERGRGGCGCRAEGSTSAGGWLLAVALLLWRRRRRPHRP